MKRLFLLLLLFPLFVGCGPKTVTVTGTVTFEGEPLKDVNVLFQPVTTGTTVPPAAAGLTNANGFYRLQLIGEQKKTGAIPGEYFVFISWMDPNQDPYPEREGYVPNPNPYENKIPDKAKLGNLQFIIPDGGPVTANWDFTEEDMKEKMTIGF